MDENQVEKERKAALVSELMGMFDTLKRERLLVEPAWKEVTTYLAPELGAFDFKETLSNRHSDLIFDGSAQAARSRLGYGLFGWLCSPSIDWLKFVPKLKRGAKSADKQTLDYLEELENYLYEAFAKSNFYAAIAQACIANAAIGTQVVNVENDEDMGCPIYTARHPREPYLSENRYGRVDTFVIECMMTNRQLLEEYKGDGLLTTKMIESAKKKPEDQVRILNFRYPRKTFIEHDEEKQTKDTMPIASTTILAGLSRDSSDIFTSAGIIRESGVKYQHDIAWRFYRVSGQVYGSSPGIDAIADIKMQNLQAKTMIDHAQFAARPAFLTTELNKGLINIRPGQGNYLQEMEFEMMQSGQYPIGIDAMQRRDAVIREHFKTDFFLAVSNIQGGARDRTATEILEMKAESAAILGAITNGMQSELIEPLVRLTMQVEKDARRLPEPPDGIDPDTAFSIQLLGPLAQAQRKYIRVQGITQGLSALAAMGSVMGPEAYANIKGNSTARELLMENGFPMHLVEDEKTATNNQAKMAQAQAQAQQQDLQLRAAEIQAKSQKGVQ
jgi:hypothetical protein